ncbi:hypothetical protein JOH50_004870 [Rhizobium leguminosarum]|uniref:hypothetical protein n=1 Tax=Rhizobium leguminosarum TaxID=384 RepID=UPI001AE418DA|nr:hypothetical protein [Rhizobium leguminosarum]MBP2489143.1 hypothetical protein [Rhizobium leguminosarum]
MGVAVPSLLLKTNRGLPALATDLRWGYWSVALLIAPAAAIAVLYPMSWILGAVPFFTTFVDIGWLKIVAIVPLLAGAFIAQANRSWLLAVMLIPGLLLSLTPEHIGTVRRADLTQIPYYPEAYDPAVFAEKIDELDQMVAHGGWIFSVFPPHVPTTEKLRGLNATAAEAKTLLAAATDAVASAARVETQIAELNARNDALTVGAECLRQASLVFRFFACIQKNQQSISANRAQIQALQQQLANLRAAPTPESRYPIVVSAAANAKVEFQVMERQTREKSAFIGAFPYLFASSLAFAILIYRAGFRSSTLAVLLLSTIAIGVFSNRPISFDDHIVDGILVLYPVFICTASAFVLRFLYRSYLDNRIIGKRFPRERVLNSLLITTLLWLPFPLVVAGVVVFNQWIYTELSDIVYCKSLPCGIEQSSFPIYDSDPTRDTLRDDVNAGIARQFARFEAEALSNAEAARGGTQEVVNAAKAKIMETYNRILPPNIYDIFPALRPPRLSDCFGFIWVDFPCIGKKIVYEKLNDAYRGPRNRGHDRLQGKINEIGEQVKDVVENAADSLKAGVKGQSEAAAAYTTKAVDATFLGFNVLSVGQMAIMLAVVMRAFLLAFGRVVYRPPGPVFKKRVVTPYLTFGHSDPVSPDCDETVTEEKKKYKVSFGHTPLIAKRAYSAADAKQSTVMWKSLTTRWHLRRLRNRCLFLKRVEAMSSSKRLSFSSGVGRSYVAWTIRPGAKVYFDWGKFVAMSEHLDLGKEITLRIGGLTLGTTMHASLSAGSREGILILESGGNVTFSHDQANPDVDSPFRLMAWRDDAAFKIVSPIHITNLYLDGPSIDPRPRAAYVALDTGREIPSFGILRELCMLLRP